MFFIYALVPSTLYCRTVVFIRYLVADSPYSSYFTPVHIAISPWLIYLQCTCFLPPPYYREICAEKISSHIWILVKRFHPPSTQDFIGSSPSANAWNRCVGTSLYVKVRSKECSTARWGCSLLFTLSTLTNLRGPITNQQEQLQLTSN